MHPSTVPFRRSTVVATRLRHTSSALALMLLVTGTAFGQAVRPIDPGITLPINPGGGGGGGGGITLPINPIGPINPINPINPGGNVPSTGPRIVTDAGMLAGKTTQAS